MNFQVTYFDKATWMKQNDATGNTVTTEDTVLTASSRTKNGVNSHFCGNPKLLKTQVIGKGD